MTVYEMRSSVWSADVCSSELRQTWLITTRLLLCPDDDERRLRGVRPGRQIATHHCTSQLTGVDRIVAGRQSIADIGGWRCPACERADADARSGRGEGLPTLERIPDRLPRVLDRKSTRLNSSH